MTRQKSFKRLVRARMEKTGESYSAARASLLASKEPKATEGPTLTMSDEAIRRRTGRGWEEWFDWGDGGTRLVVGFEAKGDAKSTASLAHEKLPDAAEAGRMKAFWRERVAV